MSLTNKLDLDGLLRRWPALDTRDDAAWEERADIIVEAAVARRSEDATALAALLDPPALAPEAGESPGATISRAGDERKMSQESDQGGRKSEAPRARPSLKEIAARASQAGAAPSGRPGSIATPVPSATRTPLPPATRTPLPPAVRTPLPGRVSSAPGEGAKEDSGIIDLNAVNKAATPEQKASADKALPATSELAFDEAAADAAAPPSEAKTQRRPARLPAPPEKKKGSGGVIAGVAIAVVGLAAAFAIMQTRQPAPAPQATNEAPAVAAEAPKGEEAPAAKPAEPAPPSGEPAAEAQPAEGSGANGKLAQGPAPGAPGAAPPQAAGGAPEPAQAQGAGQGKLPALPTAGKPGDLNTAMQAAVGDKGAAGETEAPEPAAGNPRSQNIPEQPSQGSVAAAIGSVMPSAKACVAGADDVSRAQITFSSSGAVSSVSVSGWAASNGATGCIKSALKGANVGPFAKPSYTIGIPIRP